MTTHLWLSVAITFFSDEGSVVLSRGAGDLHPELRDRVPGADRRQRAGVLGTTRRRRLKAVLADTRRTLPGQHLRRHG